MSLMKNSYFYNAIPGENIPGHEAAAEAHKKATQVLQKLDKISGCQREEILKEAIWLMYTAGIITGEQNMQLIGLIYWGGHYWEEDHWQEYFDEMKSKFIATAICEATDNYVTTGAATVGTRVGDDSKGVNLKELKIAYGIAYSARGHARKAVRLKNAVSHRADADIMQESWEKELETTRATIEKLESHIVPDIMTVQELQDIVDTTTTGTDEEKDLDRVATAIYYKIETMYRAAEPEWLGDELHRIFNTPTTEKCPR